MAERDAILRAASWWHVLRIGERQLKVALQTGVAHSMATFEFRCLGGRGFAHADNTFDATKCQLHVAQL